ncbi:MAG: hypothetical protein LW636_04710 [Planctomycetaceae bacterium]|nr:hypothetical protein [Planctomycetaceae bacterium]
MQDANPAPNSREEAVAADGHRCEWLLTDGTWIAGSLESIDGSAVGVRVDGEEAPRIIPRERIVGGVVVSRDATAATLNWIDSRERAPFIELTGGDRLPGEPKVTKDGATWVHPWIGAVPLVPELLARVRLEWDRDVARRADSDAVLLKNGDVNTGFIESIGSEIVVGPVDGSQPSEPLRISIERVAAASFAEMESPDSAGMTVAFTDATRLELRSISYTRSGGWSFEIADAKLASIEAAARATAISPGKTRRDAEIDARIAEPRTIFFGRADFSALSGMSTPKSSSPTAGFRYDPSRSVERIERSSSTLGIGDMLINGPCVAAFEPDGKHGAARPVFSCELVHAGLGDSASRVEVSISIDGERAATVMLGGGTPRAPIRIEGREGGSGAIRIELLDAGDGIAGDIVLMRRAVVVWRDGA